ncbi:MAG: OB-fold domain-containing protein [Novosphingobium sp.]|nr:OB-fold domain-containing protein [Novosphingobium sp.]
MTETTNDTLLVPRSPIRPYHFSRPYWDATREKRLVMQYCPQSGQYQHFPRPVSIATGRTALEWREVDGAGEIYSFSTTRRGFGPFQGFEPYLVVTVRLDVGVDVISNLVGCDADAVSIGMRVRPYWHPLDDGTHLLLFQPDEGPFGAVQS